MNRSIFRTATAVLAFGVLVAGVWWFFHYRSTWPRGEALCTALAPLIGGTNADASLTASAILDNYIETRTNASRWSGIYWGFSFGVVVLSVLAALILKLESFLKNEGVKKDIAAMLSVCAALLVTVSTSGDFHRKWQANRIAAAELERLGYQFLVQPDARPRAYLSSVATILHTRHVSIVGMSERSPLPEGEPGSER